MVYYKHEWQDGELITSDNLNNLESGIQSAHTQVSVKDFGALGDRVTDDTQSFIDSITKSKETGGVVFVPRGKYLISKTIDLEGVTIIGESKNNTFLLGVNIDVVFNVGYGTSIKDVNFIGSENGKKLTALNIGLQNKSVGGGIIENVNFRGVASTNQEGTINDTGFVGIKIGASSTQGSINGIFPFIFRDLQFFDVTDGIIICPEAYEFINGNHFDNIIVMGYVHSGIWLKNVENSDAISQNYFSDLQIQARSYTAKNSAGILIQHGINNYFNFVHTWTDGGKSVPSIVINSELQSDDISIRDNTFDNFKLESDIVCADIYKGINTFKNLSINDWTSGYFKSQVSTLKGSYNSIAENLVPNDLIEKLLSPIGTTLSSLDSYTKKISLDNKGYYLNINSTTTTNHLVWLNINQTTANKIKSLGRVSAGFVFDTDTPTTTIPEIKVVFKNSTNGNQYETPVILKEIGRDKNGSYIIRNIIDTSSVDPQYDLLYMGLYNRSANDMKIRELQLMYGNVGINSIVYGKKSNYYKSFGNIESPTTFKDIGINIFQGTSLINGLSFDSSLLTVTSCNGLYEYEYKIYN